MGFMSGDREVRVGDGWWVQAFDELYPMRYRHRDLGEAERFVECLGHLYPLSPGRILDLGCGDGRYLQALVARGQAPLGLDLSDPLLRSARERLLETDLVRADMRRLPLRPCSFSHVLMMFTTFGYFAEEENLRLLRNVAGLLVEGGCLVLDLINPAVLRRTLVAHSKKALEGRLVTERRWIDETGPFVCKETRVASSGTEAERVYEERVRLYEPEELDALFSSSGLRIGTRFGDYDGSSFGSGSSPRMIFVARREGSLE